MQLLLVKAIPPNINNKIIKNILFKNIFGYNLLSIDPRDMKRPPFDASSYDESNKLCYVIIQSQDSEIMRFEILPKMKIFY
jgi:hypothetical protein